MGSASGAATAALVPVPRNDAHQSVEIGNIFRKVIGCTLCNHCFAHLDAESEQNIVQGQTETILSIGTHLHMESIRGPPLHHTLLASNTHDQAQNNADFQRRNHRILDRPSVFLGTIARLERGESVSTPLRSFYFLISISSARQLHRWPSTHLGDLRPELLVAEATAT